MKLIIQIPSYNEADILPTTISALPRELEGVDEIEFLVIDDGSSDNTAKIAEANGVHHIINLPEHVGLANAFTNGLQSCLEHEADIIVNTDADNQYNSDDIQLLINPIIFDNTDIVIGDRGVSTLPGFSPIKRILQRFGSWVISKAAGVSTPDATSGFRALSRDAAIRTLVLSEYSYTLETLIQAGVKGMRVEFIPVNTNPQTRPSRLMRSIPHYLIHSITTIIRAYTMYRALRVFTVLGTLSISSGLILAGRYLYFFYIGEGGGHVQSVILSAILLIVGFQILLIGLLADLISSNRKISEETLIRLRRLELDRYPQGKTDNNVIPEES